MAESNVVSVFDGMACGMLAMMLKWHQEGYKTPIWELAESAVRLLTRPLFADADKRIS